MIYEIRTYDLRPGTVPDFEAAFCAALPEREKISKLGALWHTEIGPLNQVIHVWPYESLEHRAQCRAAAIASGAWPPPTHPFTLRQSTAIMLPAPFMGDLQPGHYGNLYEMRIYTLRYGSLQRVLELWAERIEARRTLSPLVACWYSELGTLNTFVHVWAYDDLNQRGQIRAEAIRRGIWPPPTHEFLVAQESKILIPAACSPVR
jgi:hypothetical protein